MAKEAAISTLDPRNMALGGPVYFGHALTTLKFMNWVAQNRPQIHVSQNVGVSTALASRFPSPTLALAFRSTAASWVPVLHFPIRILPETVTVNVGARCFLIGGGTTAEVRFAVGGSSVDLSFAFSDNGSEKTDQLATVSTGTGWQNVIVSIRQTTGGGTANGSAFRNHRIWDEPIASLPDPEDS